VDLLSPVFDLRRTVRQSNPSHAVHEQSSATGEIDCKTSSGGL